MNSFNDVQAYCLAVMAQVVEFCEDEETPQGQDSEGYPVLDYGLELSNEIDESGCKFTRFLITTGGPSCYVAFYHNFDDSGDDAYKIQVVTRSGPYVCRMTVTKDDAFKYLFRELAIEMMHDSYD